MKVLIVDDDPSIGRVVQALLEEDNIEVLVARDGPSALKVANDEAIDLVILDLGLPGMEGAEVFRRIRQTGDIPVIVLSGRRETSDKVDLLNLGVDDYIVKPFEPSELTARIHAVMRRALGVSSGPAKARVKVGSIEVDPFSHTVMVNGKQSVYLTPTELRLLHALMRNAGRVLTRDMLHDLAWGHDYVGGSNDVDVYIRRLRLKLEADHSDPKYILTERGVGYRFAAAPSS